MGVYAKSLLGQARRPKYQNARDLLHVNAEEI
jgi:hypothetical protein